VCFRSQARKEDFVSRKPFLTVAAVGVACLFSVLGFTACSNGSSNDATIVKAAATPQFLAESADRTSAVTTGRFEMTLALSGLPDMPSGLTFTGSGAFDAAAKRSEFSLDMSSILKAAAESGDDSGAAFLGDGKIEVIQDGDTMYMHAGFLSALLGDDSKPWIKIPADAGAADQLASGLQDATSLLGLLQDQGAKVEDKGDADVLGETMHHYHLTVSLSEAYAQAPPETRDKLEKLMDRFGMNGDAEFPMDVYVDQDGFVRRTQMSLNGETFASIGGGDGAVPSTARMDLTLDITNLGDSVDIQVPPPDQVGDGGRIGAMLKDAAGS